MATQFYYIYSYQKRGSNLRIMERGSPTRILLGKCKKLPIQSMLLIKSIFCDIQMNLLFDFIAYVTLVGDFFIS